jgi:hypothetical protein
MADDPIPNSFVLARRGGLSLLAILAAIGAASPAMAAQRPARIARSAPSFTVQIGYSPRAAAEMARRRESLGVAVFYGGEPNRLGRRHAAEDGTLTMGGEEFVVAGGPRRVTVTGRAFRPDQHGWLRGEARVTVNFYSARRSGPDNFLDCGIIEGSLSGIGGRTHRVRCRLIGER